ncbi:MAG: zf-HC2 domain-containing protein [Lentisphaeria bacterium]|nr:zf-HC2 domain-containing protein [Lentisphaeria bacterium]
MTQCKYRDSKLKLYLSGELSESENKQVELHIEQCGICNQRLELLIDQLVMSQSIDEPLSESRRATILKQIKTTRFGWVKLGFAALLMLTLGIGFMFNRPSLPIEYQVTTKMNHNFNNHQYIIEISKGVSNNSNTESSTYLIDTSYAIQLTRNFDNLKSKLSNELKGLTDGHKISVIINGGISSKPNNSLAQLTAQELFSMIYKTRLRSRPQLMEAVNNSLAYITDTNVSPERLIIFSNNTAITLEATIQKRLQQESLSNTKLSFALN